MALTGEILIVDDTPENLQVLGAILGGEGLRIRLATSGEQALRSIATRAPDLVLLDLRMPGLDGIEVCRRLHEHPATSTLPVLFLSASQDNDDRLATFSAGGLDFIAKPFQAAEVLARVSTHLELARARRGLEDTVRSEQRRRSAAEAAALDRALRLEMALTVGNMGTWEGDPRTGTLTFDEPARAVLGCTADDTPDGHAALAACFQPDEQAELLAAWERGAAGDAIFELEGWRAVAGGRRRLRLRGRRHQGRLLGLVWDVTQAHLAAQRLAHSEKLESLGQLTGGLAHDFNNHLAVILGNVDMLLAKIHGDERTIARLSAIEQATLGATALVRDMMTFARRREVELKRIPLAPVVTCLRAMLGTLLGRQIALVMEPLDPDVQVLASHEQLQNLLLNLCVNARDAMPQGGTLRLGVTRARIAEAQCRITARRIAGEFAELSVADTGSGIPDEIQDRIFEPFFTTKPEGKGTGLGLATAVGCIKAHHGHLLLDSVVGQGTTFRILLPCTEEDRHAHPAGG